MHHVDATDPITYGRLKEFPDDPIACMRRLHAAHGDLAVLQQDSGRIVFVFGPEWNQRVLSDPRRFHSRFFAIRGPRKSAQRRLTCGLLSMNGAEHKQHRRLVMGPFQKKALGRYRDHISHLTQEMLDDWQPGEVRDIREEMTQYMLRLTSAILFGLNRPELAYETGEMIDRWVALNHQTGLGAFLPDEDFTASYDRLLAMAESLEEMIRQMIELKRSERPTGDSDDVLTLLIRAHSEEGILDDEKLIGQVALLFAAAHLTTAHTFAWTLFLLAQHPAVMRDLWRELNSSAVSTNQEATLPAGKATAGSSLLERVIKESMRILPASAYSQRITAEPVQLGSLDLPAGTLVVFSQFMTHHRPELYPEPRTFAPDRWLNQTRSAYEYLPFGAGARMCLGGPLALNILQTALPMILRRYRLTVQDHAEINGRVISTMLGPTTPVPMHIAEQDGQFASRPVGGNIHELVDLPDPAAAGRKAA